MNKLEKTVTKSCKRQEEKILKKLAIRITSILYTASGCTA